MNGDNFPEPPDKPCCLYHAKARNRTERRAADKNCPVKRAERK